MFINRLDPVVVDDNPEIVVVPRDVNSTLACALVARKLQARVARGEAAVRGKVWTMGARQTGSACSIPRAERTQRRRGLGGWLTNPGQEYVERNNWKRKQGEYIDLVDRLALASFNGVGLRD
ncbi:MAG: hypothetical protein IH602_23235 [Bryobacteraceae bacterium]|nr:hypothetical protein [Bryobacteraceae bacterium]